MAFGSRRYTGKGNARIRFVSYKDRVDRAVQDELAERLKLATILWVGQIRREMTGTKSGRWYFIPGTKVKYQASSEIETPAVRTGVLRASYGSDVDKARLIGYAGSDLDYSLWLERGTRRMSPRPVIEKALRKIADEVTAILTGEIK